MNLRLVCLAAVLFASLRSTATAQSRRDFTGVWTTPQERGPIAAAGDPRGPSGGLGSAVFRSGDMGSGWGASITLSHNVSRLTLEYVLFSAYDLQPPLALSYMLDGSESRNQVMIGHTSQTLRSTSRWNGDTLVLTTLHPFNHPVTGETTSQIQHALWLTSPVTLRVDATRAGVAGGLPTTTSTTYTKR